MPDRLPPSPPPPRPPGPVGEAGEAGEDRLGAGSRPLLSAADFARLGAFIQDRFGIRMPPAKRTLLEARLAKRVRALGLSGFTAYCDLVLGGGRTDELVELVDRVTTHKTDFFREPQHFEILVQTVLPELAARRAAGRDRELRVWSAACSTGEEPYTLAMVLAEQPGLRFRILATDLSEGVLRQAAEATYPEPLIAPIPLPLRRKYLMRSVADPEVVKVRRSLRATVGFQQLNLLAPSYAVGGRLDVIFCRNVFIYFDRPTQGEILRRFEAALGPGGYLFMGHSESINGQAGAFQAVAPTVYRVRQEGGP
ncbi:MAG: protein-glutamate O-methyltransferase [Anaeromyxobacter sp.]